MPCHARTHRTRTTSHESTKERQATQKNRKRPIRYQLHERHSMPCHAQRACKRRPRKERERERKREKETMMHSPRSVPGAHPSIHPSIHPPSPSYLIPSHPIPWPRCRRQRLPAASIHDDLRRARKEEESSRRKEREMPKLGIDARCGCWVLSSSHSRESSRRVSCLVSVSSMGWVGDNYDGCVSERKRERERDEPCPSSPM
jgi:hypothetical protein